VTVVQSPEIDQLAVALCQFQAVVENARKGSVNPLYKSKYADIESVWDTIRKPLTDHGLSIVQMPEEAEPGFVGLHTRLFHKSGQFIGSSVKCPLQKNDAQGLGSALTYLRRYALMGFCGVAPEDDDGNQAVAAPAVTTAAPLPESQVVAGKDYPMALLASHDDGLARIRNFIKAEGLTDEVVLNHFGIAHYGQYMGTASQFKEEVSAYAQERRAAETVK
jgi:hypothetical protein